MRRRVLIVKLGAIGDVVMLIPAAYEMHKAGYEVEWICGEQVLPLLRLYPWILPIGVSEQALFGGSVRGRFRALTGLWRRLAGRRYELCATLYYDARYRVVSLPVRAKQRVMLSHTDRLRRLMPGRHHTDEYMRVMLGRDAGPVAVGLAPVRPETFPASEIPRIDGRQRVLLVPGGARNAMRSDGLRRWPVLNYVEVARRMIELGLDVVLVGGADDVWTSDAFAGVEVENRIGTLSIVETLALMDASDVVVTHDTGPLHLAGMTSVGVVSIFGPTDPRGRLPQRAGAVALWGGEGFACRPCYDGRDYAPCRENACMQQVTAEMVVREVEEMLRQRRVGAMLPPRIATPLSTVTAHPPTARRRDG